LLVLGIAVAGCGDSSSLEVRELLLERKMVIGEMDDPHYAFNRVAGIAVDGRGHLYVADAGDSRIRVYSRQGRFVRDIGKPGHGPGEFLLIERVGVLSDTVYIIDRQANRISYFDSTGTLHRTVRAAHGSFGPKATVTFPFKLLRGGRELSIPMSRSASDGMSTFLLTRAGEVVDTLLNVASHTRLEFRKGRGLLFAHNPFAQPVIFQVSASGEYSAMITRAHPEGDLEAGEFEARMDRVGGATVWTKVFRDEPVVYSSRKADSLIAASQTSFAEMARQLRASPAEIVTEAEFRSAARPPEFEWPVQAAAVGDDGRLYLRRPSSGDSAEYLVIGPAGKVEGRIRLPRSAGHMIARGDTIIVVERDALDVATVVEYRYQ
jgi:hypothetical protein